MTDDDAWIVHAGETVVFLLKSLGEYRICAAANLVQTKVVVSFHEAEQAKEHAVALWENHEEIRTWTSRRAAYLVAKAIFVYHAVKPCGFWTWVLDERTSMLIDCVAVDLAEVGIWTPVDDMVSERDKALEQYRQRVEHQARQDDEQLIHRRSLVRAPS